MRKGLVIVFLLFIVLALQLVYAVEVDKNIERELSINKTSKVWVKLKDSKINLRLGANSDSSNIISEGKWGKFKLRRNFPKYNAFSAEVDNATLEQLRTDSRVESIDYVYPIEKDLDLSTPITRANNVWPFQVNGINLTGTGEVICVLDTGVNYHHPIFGNCTLSMVQNGSCPRIVAGYDFGNGDSDPIDVDSASHGTNVAGIVISNDTTYRGIAPNAKIAAIKVFADDGTGSSDNIISGLDWCINNATKFNISVITMSLSFTGFYSNSSCNSYITAVTDEITTAIKNNISVIASSGNDNNWGIKAPACIENVTSVGAVYDSDMGPIAWSVCTDSTTGTDNITCFTDRGPNLDLLAPGARVTSADKIGGFATISGTSQAAPMVAGASAILHEYLKQQNGTASPFVIVNALNKSGDFINDTAMTNISFARINILNAIRYLDASPPQTMLVYPQNGSYFNSRNISFNFTLNDPKPIANATLYGNFSAGFLFGLNASNTTTLTNSNLTTITVSNVTEGVWLWNIYSCDNSSKCGLATANYTFTVDLTPPAINFTPATPDNNSRVSSNSIFVNVSIAEANFANISYYLFSSSGVLISQANYTNLTTYYNFTGLSDGNYSFNATVYDLVGFKNSTPTYTITVDAAAPLPQGTVTVTGTNKTNTTLIFNITWKDSPGSGEGLSGYIFSQNQSGTFVNSSWTAFSAGNVSTASLNVTLVHNQGFSFQFFANDSSGNINSTPLASLLVANSLPGQATVLSPPNASTNISINISAQSTDADNETVSFFYFVNGSLIANSNSSIIFNGSNGLYYVDVLASDGFDNATANSSRIQFTKNATPSITGVSSGSPGTSSTTITWTTDLAANSTINYGLTASLGSSAVDSSQVTSHSIPLSSLSSSTTYYYNVTSCDWSSMCNTTGPLSFATSAVSTTSSSGGGGGGGGGGSGGVAPAASNQQTFITVFNAGETKSIEPAISGYPVDKIEVTSTASTQASFTFEKVDSKPETAPDIQQPVNSYFSIAKSVNDSAISLVRIHFSVEKSWLAANNASKDSIVLERLKSIWNLLPTGIVNETQSTINYIAISPGLSYFAISIIEQPKPKNETEYISKPLDSVKTENITQVSVNESPSKIVETKKSPKIPAYAFWLLVGIMGVGVIFLVTRKKKDEKQDKH